MPWDIAGSVSALQHQDPWINPKLGFLSVLSFCAGALSMSGNPLGSLGSSHLSQHASRWIGYAWCQYVCVLGALWRTGILFWVYSCLLPSVTRIDFGSIMTLMRKRVYGKKRVKIYAHALYNLFYIHSNLKKCNHLTINFEIYMYSIG